MKRISFQRRCRLDVLFVVVVAFMLMQQDARSAEWENGIDAVLGVVRSDNIFLDPPGAEESDVVYLIAPTFYARTNGERLVADLNYAPEAYYYNDFSDSNQVYHMLDAQLTAALIQDRFYVSLDAVNSQMIVTPDGRIPLDNLLITDNRVDAFYYEVRPYWSQRIKNVDLLVATSYRAVEYDVDEFQSSNERSAEFSLNNFERQVGFAWGVDYSFRRTEYEVSPPWEFQRASLNLGRWVTSAWRVFAVGGKETSFDNLFDANLDADFWEAGFQFAPNARFNMELAAGDRSYGRSFRGNLEYTLRRGEVSIGYSEAPATRSELVFDRQPIVTSSGFESVLDLSGQDDRFVLKRGYFVVAVETARTMIDFRLYAEDRENVTNSAGEPLESELLIGADFDWSWRVGRKTTAAIGVGYTKREALRSLESGTPIVYDDVIKFASGGITYEIGSRASIIAEYRRRQGGGDPESLVNTDENQVRLMLNLSL